VRQLRDAIQAQFKDEGVVLCDIGFGGKKHTSQQNPRQKKFKYVVIGILLVFDHLIG
jgi:hypothetical protein